MKKVGITLFAIVISSLSLKSQNIVDVLEAHGAVMGFKALDEVESMVIKGSTYMGNRGSAPFALYRIKPDKMRTETEMMGRKMLMIRNGDKGWASDLRNGGYREIGSGEGSVERGRAMGNRGRGQGAGMRMGMSRQTGQSAMGGTLFDWEKKQLDVSLEGEEEFEGATVYKVKSVDTLGNITYSYIDVDSFVLLKETSERSFQGRQFKSSRIFSNYEIIDDIAVAFNVENKREMPQGSSGTGRGGRAGGRGFGGTTPTASS